MSDVISFLQQMGQSAALRHATKPALYKALNAQAVDQTAQWAIMGGDVARLEALLAAPTNMVCGLLAPNPDETLIEATAQYERQVA